MYKDVKSITCQIHPISLINKNNFFKVGHGWNTRQGWGEVYGKNLTWH